MEAEELSERLAEFLRDWHGASSVRIEGLRLLAGGAHRETWSFDAKIEKPGENSLTLALVLRREPHAGLEGMERTLEYQLLRAAHDAGVPAPRVHPFVDDPSDLPFLLMDRVEGETIARRLLRDEVYAGARKTMTAQLGAALARIHRIPLATPGFERLPTPGGRSPAEAELDRIEEIYRSITPDSHPAFELAFRWLRKRLPAGAERTLVHGDFRIGNVIFGPEGLRAILDWEGAHIGDPVEDLGWFCVRSWRFGSDNLPAGGIGSREELWDAYERAGGSHVDPERARFWEAFGNLRWGVICIMQAKPFLDGVNPSVELAAIGRRTAETEWELLNLMDEGR